MVCVYINIWGGVCVCMCIYTRDRNQLKGTLKPKFKKSFNFGEPKFRLCIICVTGFPKFLFNSENIGPN